jgi:hypothetical protein
VAPLATTSAADLLRYLQGFPISSLPPLNISSFGDAHLSIEVSC